MKFRVRNLVARFPVLERFRLGLLSGICQYGTSFFDHSYRVIRIESPKARQLIEQGQPAMIALYHGRMVGLLQVVQPREKLTVLVSVSRDGEIIARAIEALGFRLARGSPEKRAIGGSMELINAARGGQNLAVTVDGPQGPIYEVKDGIIRLAQMCEVPILPFVCAARSFWTFWGWDRFMGPLWSTPILYVIGDPIFIDKEADEEGRELVRKRLETMLNKMRVSAEEFWK